MAASVDTDPIEGSAFAAEANRTASLNAVLLGLVIASGGYYLSRHWWVATGDAYVIVPVLYAVAVIGAAACTYLLLLRARIVQEPVTMWVAGAVGVAGLAAFAQGTAIVQLQHSPTASMASGAALLYLIWHAAVPLLVLGGLVCPERRRLLVAACVIFLVLILLVLQEPGWLQVPTLVSEGGAFTTGYRAALSILLALTVAVTVWWAVQHGPRPARAQTWVLVALTLGTLELVLASGAGEFFEAIWWSSAALRAATFALPAVGLLADAGRLLRALERHEHGLSRRLADELRRARRELAPVEVDRAEAVARIEGALEDQQVRAVYQPIYSLATGRLAAVEALSRFDADHQRPPNEWFAEAEAVGLGAELELAAARAAVAGSHVLPPGVPLAINISPSVMSSPELLELTRASDRPLVFEITEHAAVEDYRQLHDACSALRRHGARIAVDDAGAGFASFRHIVRLTPDVIKLDMTLTRDIHLDPVRRSLAACLVEFANEIGALLVAEGIEQPEEVTAWQRLGAHAAQGYLFARPSPDTPASRTDLVHLHRELAVETTRA